MKKFLRKVLTLSIITSLLMTNNVFASDVDLSKKTYESTNIETKLIVSEDPIHPYIHALFNEGYLNEEIVLLDKDSQIVTSKVRNDIRTFYNEKNSDAISEYLNENSIEFRFRL
jgi:hypothetical protein